MPEDDGEKEGNVAEGDVFKPSRLRSGVTKSARKRGTKTGCKAKMIVKDAHFQNRWEVIVLELEHNHPLDPSLLKFKKQLKNSPFLQNPPRMSEAPESSSTAALSSRGGDSGMPLSTQIEFKTKIDRNRKLKLAEGMSITERSDNAADYFDGWLMPDTSVKMFVEQYESAVKVKLEKENYEDLRSSQMRPPVMTGLPVEEQAAKAS
ncbi:hypothetical protein E2562_023806 [Oryza meyeriana var. granulata]|uniref:Protein FAR1-RELATED SEQUENCE n=1 Tax=Oryza meyeriana var. granulata TaxID=110450 RepID=A0A6G1D6Y7_9ORYZ|nr:hypothetical protein E2562_023806 [Oryza meyeriana var. granulata]